MTQPNGPLGRRIYTRETPRREPEWVRRMREGKHPAKDMSKAPTW